MPRLPDSAADPAVETRRIESNAMPIGVDAHITQHVWEVS
jgi:hypothetical protein